MIINNISIKKFGAVCEKKMPSHKSVSISNDWNINPFSPIELRENIEPGTLPVRIKFEGANRDIINKNISDFLVQAKKCDIKFRNLSNNFKCYYLSHTLEESGIDEWIFMDIEFNYIEYSDMTIANVSGTTLINNKGNEITPAIVEIIPTIDIIDITLEGLSVDPIAIRNLKANKKLIIDGELQKVTVDGANKYADTDMWDFPRLMPGQNTIKVSRDNCDIKIKYKPRWI